MVNLLAVVGGQFILIVFSILAGFVNIRTSKDLNTDKMGFWIGLICFSVAIIEIPVTLGLIYITESGGDIVPLLWINLISAGFVLFLLGWIVTLRLLHSVFDLTPGAERLKEW